MYSVHCPHLLTVGLIRAGLQSAAPTCTSVSVNVPEIWRWFDVDASVTPDDQSARLDEVEVEVELEKDKVCT